MERFPHRQRAQHHRLSHLQPTGEAIPGNSQCSLYHPIRPGSWILLWDTSREIRVSSLIHPGCCSSFLFFIIYIRLVSFDNMLSHQAEMQRTQINNYCRNQITRLDIDVLARLCTVLNCEIGDLLEFVPPEEKKEWDSQERVYCSALWVFFSCQTYKLK